MSDTRTLTVSVVTPEGTAYEGQAQHVVVPAYDGEMAFYPAHAPLVGVLGSGELRITRANGALEVHYLSGGVVQVAGDEVSILADVVVPAPKLDAEDARRRLAEAMATPAVGDVEIDMRQARMDEARARLWVAERSRVRRAPTAAQILDAPVE